MSAIRHRIDSAQMASEDITNDSMSSPVPLKTKSIYKLLLAYRTTYYKGQWYCYVCKDYLHNFAEAKRHPHKNHSDIRYISQMSDFLNFVDQFSDTDCEQFLKHGIVIHDLPTHYFCINCHCSVHTLNSVAQHIKGKKHQKHAITSIENIESIQENLDGYINSTQSNVSIEEEKVSIEEISIDEEILMKHVNRLDSVTETQAICENKFLKDPRNDSVQMTNNIKNDFTLSSVSPMNKSVDIYKLLLAHCITCYKEQWYCYLCKFQLQDFAEAKHHLQETHSDISINVSDLLNITDQFSDIDIDCKQFLNHGIVIEALPDHYFCVYCQCSILFLNSILSHVKGKKHQKHKNAITMKDDKSVQKNLDDYTSSTENIPIDEETLMKYVNGSDCLTETQAVCENKLLKDFPNNSAQMASEVITNHSISSPVSSKAKSVYKLLLAYRITYYKQWYCYLCNSHLQNFAEIKHHLQEIHSDISSHTPDFLNVVDKFSDTKCEQLLKHGIVIHTLPEEYFCMYCHCLIHTLSSVAQHIKAKKHPKRVNAITTIKDIESMQKDLNDYINSTQSNVSVDEGTSLEHINESESLTKIQMCENKISKKKLRWRNETFEGMKLYKYLMAQRITYYNEQWYCYLCKSMLLNIAEAKWHSQKDHPDIQILDFSNDFNQLSDKKSRTFLKQGIVIRELPNHYFCIHCRCSIYDLCNVKSHLIEAEHKSCIRVAQNIKSVEQNLHDNISNEHSHVSIDRDTMDDVSQSRTTEVQTIDGNKQKYIDKILSDPFIEVVKSLSSSPEIKFTNIYQYLLAQRLTYYNKQWYCYLCECELQSIDVAHHLRENHSDNDSQVSDILENLADLSYTKCRELLNHGIVIMDLQNYFCMYCHCSIHTVIIRFINNIAQHIKAKKHSMQVNATTTIKNIEGIQENLNDHMNSIQSNVSVDEGILMDNVNQSRTTEVTTETMDGSEQKCIDKISNPFVEVAKSLSSSPQIKFTNIYKYFLAQRLTRYNKQWYCYLCECILQNMEIERHLRENHSDINSEILDFMENLADLSDMKCRELLNHGIVITDLQNYFCVPCQCPMLSLYHIDGHVKGNKHKKHVKNVLKFPEEKNILKISDDRISDKQNNVSVDVETTTQYFNEPEFSAKIQAICERKLVKSFSYDPDTEENTLSSNFKENNENDDILDIEKTVDVLFCSLCEVFVHNISTREHTLNEQHISYSIKIFNLEQAKYIIELGTKRNIIRPLQLNIRKLDGAIWPKYTASTTMFTCDKCDEIIEENDLINHEILLHKDNVKSIPSNVNNQTFMFKIKLLVHIYDSRFKNYPMFKCSFCNEIIHGVIFLQDHFSKHKHEENMIKLAQIKKQEYNYCKSAEDCLEPLEFLSIISLKNINETLQAMEQPVIYIKARSTRCKKSKCVVIRKQFTYICIICQCVFHHTQHIITHFKKKKDIHLHHFESILHTYNLMYRDMYLAPSLKKHNTFKSQMMKPSVCTMDMSINSQDKLEEPIHETRLMRQINNYLEITRNTDSEDDLSYEDEFEANATDFFMSPDISADINAFIKKETSEKYALKLVRIVPDEISISALDYYNKIYEKKYLEFEEIMFICNYEILKNIKCNLHFYVPCPDGSIRCLVCNITHSYNANALFEHSRTPKHIRYLELLMDPVNKEKFKLSRELIKADSTGTKCYACDVKLLPESSTITHINIDLHQTNREKLLLQMENIMEEFKTLWYSIQYFSCVVCNFRYKRKIDFMEHLQRHIKIGRINDNSNFDFCLTCASLWYTKEQPITYTYSIHCEKQTHQYLVKTNDFAIKPLPQILQKLLNNVDETVVKLFDQAENVLTDPRPIQLKNELEYIFKTCNLPVVMCIFGSRVTGLALLNSDVDIYLNFGNECTDLEIIKSRSKQIQNCLRTDRDNWEIELALEKSRTPVIKLRHMLTGLHCDLTFLNGLSVENSKLIKSFNMAYPPCQILILFLKKWMCLGGLSGYRAITNYALTWLVIFYLQVEYKIPSVADLIKKHNKSKIVGGWETGVGNIVPINIPELSIYELLLGFFRYYGKFDYMHYVICPLLGEVCYKESFTEETNLPEAMALYVSQLSSTRVEYFRIDSPMCVQDPFDLSHNLTKAMPILMLKRFKQYCNDSASVLCNIISPTSSEKVSTLSKKRK